VTPLNMRYLAPLLATLLLRGIFLLAADGATFLGDEGEVLRHGRTWAEFGVYAGTDAPGRAALAALGFEWFGDSGVRAVRVALTLLSVALTAAAMLLARVVAGPRAAVFTGWLTALYLPLVPHAHVLTGEVPRLVLLVPALALLAAVERSARHRDDALPHPAPNEPSAPRDTRFRVAAGVLLGLGALVHESTLLVPIAYAARALVRREALAGALVLVPALAVIAPWTARNLAVYGKVVPVGLDSADIARDYLGPDPRTGAGGTWDHGWADVARLSEPIPSGVPGAAARRALGDASTAEAWPRADHPVVALRARADLLRAAGWAARHPVSATRQAALRLGDSLAPFGDLTRHLRLGAYHAPLESRPARLALAGLATLQLLALGVLAALAWGTAHLRPGARALTFVMLPAALLPALCTGATTARAPLELAALVGVAAWATAPRERPSVWRCVGAGAILAMLAAACWLDLPPLVASFRAFR
jgi:hypothetical protein